MKPAISIPQIGHVVAPDVQSKVALYPYFGTETPKPQTLHQLIASAQTQGNNHRRSDFDARLVELRNRGESLRSFPTDVRSISWHIDGRQDSKELLAYREQANVPSVSEEAHAADGLSEDPYPYGIPPIDASAYGGVDVDPEYDLSAAAHPVGEEGQPDVHDWSNATVGIITKIGFFHYRYKRSENKTHLIRIGTKDHWGVDLERVVREFSLVEGEHIALMCIGKQHVVIKVRVKQEDGTFKMEDKDAERNTWVCKRL